MICPNKFLSLDDSIVGKMHHLFMASGTKITLVDLRNSTSRYFADVGEFILALDTLYVLGKINFDHATGVVTYVD